MATRKCAESTFRVFEKEKDASGKEYYPCVIIAQGLGNLSDKNYYTSEAIESGKEIYEGAQCYFNHPTDKESQERPGRSVLELAGHFEDCEVKETKGLKELRAKLYPMQGKDDAITLIEHCIKYKKKYPNKDFIGISINGDGEGLSMDYEQFLKEVQPTSEEMKKIEEVKGQNINVITKLTQAISADLVTAAGAKGRLGEENKKQKNKERLMSLLESFQKLLKGIQTNDKSLREDAVKGMLQADEGDADKEKKEADDKAAAEADSMAKHMLQAKKDLKKEDGESDEAYETKCMKQAMAKHAEAQEALKKEADEKEKKEKGEKKEGDDDKKAAADADKDKKKDDKKDDKGHADADQDKDLMKKMMGEIEGLKKEMAELKKGKEKAESEAKEARESAAASNITLKVKEREELIDRVLRESGLPRIVTDELRPVLAKCKNETEMKATAKTLADAHERAISEMFYGVSNTGIQERAADGEGSATDNLFN